MLPASYKRFNRDIVECKGISALLQKSLFRDLIETLWNVKDDNLLKVATEQMRFNRDIVECKARLHLQFSHLL